MWSERGLAPELLQRARAVRIPDGRLRGLLLWDAPPQRVEEEIGWADKLLHGPMRFRQVTVSDNDDFCALWANSPEEIGEWDVTVERGPNGFAQFELQERPTLNVLFHGSLMVACVSFSLRHTLVGGQRIWVRYGQAMRVHRDHRRHGYGHWVRSLPWAIGIGRATEIQYDYIRSHNMTMEQWNRKHMPNVESVPVREGEVPGIPVTVLEFPARAGSGRLAGVRSASGDDIGRVVELINRTHAGRDLFRPYTVEFMTDRLERALPIPEPHRARGPYCIDDFYVLESGGEMVACAGLWDRGRDLRERWRHRETGEERVISVTALLDIGFAKGHESEMAELIAHLIGVTHEGGRDYLVAPLETLPEVAALLAAHDPVPDTRYLQWRGDTPKLTPPTHLDLVYW